MVIYVDIDGTICNHTDGKYKEAKPRYDQILKINKLYSEGHEIVYWTGRGGTTNIDWSELTESQLQEWGCRYTRIERRKKPYYDLFICDKSKRIEEILNDNKKRHNRL